MERCEVVFHLSSQGRLQQWRSTDLEIDWVLTDRTQNHIKRNRRYATQCGEKQAVRWTAWVRLEWAEVRGAAIEDEWGKGKQSDGQKQHLQSLKKHRIIVKTAESPTHFEFDERKRWVLPQLGNYKHTQSQNGSQAYHPTDHQCMCRQNQ